MQYKFRKAIVYIGAIDSTLDLKITGLRIKFDIKKTNKKDVNTAKIEIYNISSSTYEELKNSGKLRVLVEAGYEENTAVIFQGDVLKFTRKPGDKDIVYTIEAKDSLYTLRNLRTSVSYDDGTPLRAIIEDMVSKMHEYSGIVRGNIDSVIDAYTIEHGISLAGQMDEILSDLTDDYFLSWRFEDGVLFIESADGANYQDTAIVLSSGVDGEVNTGLIGFPEYIDSGQKGIKKKTNKRKKVEKGLKVISFLNPFYKIYKRVDLRSNYYNGEYKIKEITFKGDTHSKEWYAELLLI